ncbi:hypothetical protein [Nocardioides sp. WS12]|uniref:nitric oxide reductase activation protein NorD n=1 Tax=Nocardioides sp. WS12 TaxID=2486272 RepID=UPI0015FA294F|nr:hypothetical protein [Nocardioides sp. WS12]
MDTLALLASAVAGRTVELRMSRHGVYADGRAIHVPEGTGDEIVAAVACQAALLSAGSFDPTTMKRLARAGDPAAARFLSLEVVRACRTLDAVLPRRIVRDIEAHAGQADPTTSATDSLTRALGRGPVSAPPPWFGEMRPRAACAPSTRAALDPNEVAEALRRAAAEMHDSDSPDSDSKTSTELLDRQTARRQGARRRLRQRLTAGRVDRSNGGEEVVAASRRTIDGTRVPELGVPIGPVMMSGLQVRGRSYPEWDQNLGGYRDAWCTVAEFDPPPADRPLATSSADASLLGALARLGLRHRLNPRETEGDDLDLSGLIDHRVDVAAGFSGVPRVHRAERRTEPDLGVLLLLDATGSTADEDGPSSVFEAQRDLAAALTTAFDELGQRVATYAFQTRGRHGVQVLRCKDFEETWSGRARLRLQSVEPAGFTRVGAVIRHGTHLLVHQAGTRRRLMVVIGDGIPYDDGYEGPYAVADARRAITEAGAFGVACVGLSTTAPSGQSLWPAHAEGRASDRAALATLAQPLFAGAIQRATHHTRLQTG